MSNNFDILEALWLRKEKKRRAQKIIEGALPLTYTAKNVGTLKNYRIYGNTVDGESVGDRTGNLFDYVSMSEGVARTYINVDGDELANGGWNVTDYIPCDGTVFTLDIKPYTGTLPAICLYDGNKQYITGADYNGRSTITVIANQNAKYIRFSYSNNYDLSVVMLNSGSTALPYEPYGYKVPVTVSNGTDTLTTPIYLSEQIRKVGDEAEYIDYAEQKQHFADGTSVDITLPALPTIAGTNTLSVGTEVQPSKVMVRGKLKE